LLEKTANEGKKGAGQFFTPRPVIQAIVNVMRPNPLEEKKFKISDTACGTAGFLTMAVEWAKENLPLSKWNSIKDSCYYGQELVVRPYRLALMNLFLHGVHANLTLGDSIYTENFYKESLNCILTNPPFGTRGSSGPPKQRVFPVITSNIQINFIQHIYELLKPNGRAAIVLPDSALTDAKAKEVWQILINSKQCNIHTILRLPRGTFNPYANGVKACVVFLHKGVPTKDIWVYDGRTNFEEINKSSRPLNYEKHFADFVKSYGNDPNGQTNRKETKNFRKFSLMEIKKKEYDLSFNTLYQPPELEAPIFYVDKLIENFEKQLLDLQKLKKLLAPKKNG
jgi:type I restriction enzyme M protein